MNLKLFLGILRKRLGLMLLTLAITLGIAGYFTFTEPKRYVASTSLVLNLEQRGPFETTAVPAQLSGTQLATQLDIIRSQKVAQKVVELRGLDRDQGWRDAYEQAGPTSIPIKEWIATQVAGNVDAEPLENSRVVVISYEALDPDEAARMADAYAQAFVATTLDLTMEPARRNADWFNGQLKVLRSRLDAARTRVAEMQVERGVVALDEKLGAETTRLDDITRSLVEAQSATYALRSRQLGENHPEYRSAVARVAALTSALNEQKRNIMKLRAQRAELDALAREVETEQENYSATLQTYFRAAMESQFNQTNIAILSAALPPSEPSSPNVPLNMISAVVLGLMLGLAVAVGAEMLAISLATPAAGEVYRPQAGAPRKLDEKAEKRSVTQMRDYL